MPRLWTDTIEAHRRAVRDAALDAAAALVAEHGVRGVTMSKIADATGISRATLYKYFPDVEAILLAWHERQVAGHLEDLRALREHAPDPASALAAVLEAYALIHHGMAQHQASGAGHAGDVVAVLHRSPHVSEAQREVSDFVGEVLREAAGSEVIRRDVAARELTAYCLHALSAAAELGSKAAVQRLVAVTLDALRPARS